MSYSESNGQLILTMSREDYDDLLTVFAMATVWAARKEQWHGPELQSTIDLMNRLNSGNPNYTPYQVEGEKKC